MNREDLIKGLFLILFGLLLMFLGISLIIYGFYDVQRFKTLEGINGLIMISDWFSTVGIVLVGVGLLTIIFGIRILKGSYNDDKMYYWCKSCKCYHHSNSKKGKAHQRHAGKKVSKPYYAKIKTWYIRRG